MLFDRIGCPMIFVEGANEEEVEHIVGDGCLWDSDRLPQEI